MSSGDKKIDKIFLGAVISLLVIGFAIFISASMGILAKDSAQFYSVVSKQVFFGLVLGTIACFIASKIDYKKYKKHAFYVLLFAIILCLLVFVPGVGSDLNTFAKRWIVVFGFSFQPVAILNIAVIIYWATWLSAMKEKVSTFRYGFLPLLILLSVCGLLLLKQPDTDSLVAIVATCTGMYWIGGGKFKYVLLICLIGFVSIAFLAFTRPYVMSRIQTYFNPADNAQTSSFQIQQATIAVGSGQMFGKGLGQSIQKYKFLPESISDTIFAVLAEEGGFFWSTIIIFLFILFAFRGFKIAINAPDIYGGLLVAGIVILTIVQSFANIGSVLGIIPFSGLPLAFFSQGGTAMLMVLAEIGIVLNVSKFRKNI